MEFKFLFNSVLASKSRIQIVREIKNILGVSLKEAEDIFDNPFTILSTTKYPNLFDLIVRLKELDNNIIISPIVDKDTKIVALTKEEYDRLKAYNDAYSILYNSLSSIECMVQRNMFLADEKVKEYK